MKKLLSFIENIGLTIFYAFFGLLSSVAKLLGTIKITLNQKRLLNEMRKDNALAPFPYGPTAYWKTLNNKLNIWIHLKGTSKVEKDHAFLIYSTDRITNPAYFRHACTMLYNHVKARDTYGALDKINSLAVEQTSFPISLEGKMWTWDVLLSLDSIFSIAEVDPTILTKKVTILDLGSGWGRFGFVLQMINKRSLYIACDLPESLFITSSYLPTILRQTRFYPYGQHKELKILSRQKLQNMNGIYFIGTQDLEKFEDGSIDFVINTSSFQEMIPKQTNVYLQIIDKKLKGYLYSQQHYKNNTNFDDYIYPNRWKKIFIRNAYFSVDYFEALFKTR